MGETDYSVTVKLKAFRLLEARVAEVEERLGKRLEALERPPVGTAVTHNRVSRIEERVAELAERVDRLSANGDAFIFRTDEAIVDLSDRVATLEVYVKPAGTESRRHKALPEEKYRLIEQVLKAAGELRDFWRDCGINTNVPPYEESAPGPTLCLAVDAYRKQADQ